MAILLGKFKFLEWHTAGGRSKHISCAEKFGMLISTFAGRGGVPFECSAADGLPIGAAADREAAPGSDPGGAACAAHAARRRRLRGGAAAAHVHAGLLRNLALGLGVRRAVAQHHSNHQVCSTFGREQA